MLVIPIDPRYTQGRFAIATCALILLNVLIFAFTMPGRQAAANEAMHFYYDSGQIQFEFPFYLQVLDARGDTELMQQLSEQNTDNR